MEAFRFLRGSPPTRGPNPPPLLRASESRIRVRRRCIEKAIFRFIAIATNIFPRVNETTETEESRGASFSSACSIGKSIPLTSLKRPFMVASGASQSDAFSVSIHRQ
jgi:hypothetical protein